MLHVLHRLSYYLFLNTDNANVASSRSLCFRDSNSVFETKAETFLWYFTKQTSPPSGLGGSLYTFTASERRSLGAVGTQSLGQNQLRKMLKRVNTLFLTWIVYFQKVLTDDEWQQCNSAYCPHNEPLAVALDPIRTPTSFGREAKTTGPLPFLSPSHNWTNPQSTHSLPVLDKHMWEASPPRPWRQGGHND